MTEQEENELIAERLLGWERCTLADVIYPSDVPRWHGPGFGHRQGHPSRNTPTFTTWAEAGLILDALAAQWPASKVFFRGLGGSMILGGLTAPEIRDAALEYIRAAGEV